MTLQKPQYETPVSVLPEPGARGWFLEAYSKNFEETTSLEAASPGPTRSLHYSVRERLKRHCNLPVNSPRATAPTTSPSSRASFGKKVGQAGFDIRADVNGDGVVNILDLSAEARLMPAGTVCQSGKLNIPIFSLWECRDSTTSRFLFANSIASDIRI